jgi:hypothetical protein
MLVELGFGVFIIGIVVAAIVVWRMHSVQPKAAETIETVNTELPLTDPVQALQYMAGSSSEKFFPPGIDPHSVITTEPVDSEDAL